MHVEICIEDSSGRVFLERMLPKIFGGLDLTWRVHGYGGIGRIPKNLTGTLDVKKRALLDRLPKLIRGCANTPWIDALVVIVDTDDRDQVIFLKELNQTAASVDPRARVIFTLAIEEMEAWYFGDQQAILAAYPGAKLGQMLNYQQDSVCGTWERLADMIAAGGAAKLKADGWPASGVAKSEWALRITPHMDPDRNISPSFIALREELRALAI